MKHNRRGHDIPYRGHVLMLTAALCIIAEPAVSFGPEGPSPVPPAVTVTKEDDLEQSRSPDRIEPAPAEMEDVGIEEKLGQTVPGDLAFTDSNGRAVTLGDYFNQNDMPVVLNLGYYRCPMLCDLVIHGLAESAGQLSWTPGEDYRILTVSFDPAETPGLAGTKKQMAITRLNKPGADAGWHFLVGDQQSIDRLTGSVGFKYKWLDDQNVFSHTAAIIILTPEGRVSRYLYGITYPSSSIRLALLEASEGEIGSTVEQILMYCFHYDPESGEYTLAARRVMSLGGLITVIVLVAAIGAMLVREFIKRSGGASASNGEGN